MKRLTTAQALAVGSPSSRPLAIVAGAGAGKTLVLLRRALALPPTHSPGGGPPLPVLILTFSRAAAAEVRSRLAAAAPTTTTAPLPGAHVTTFHALGLAVLRSATDAELEPLSRKRGFSLYPTRQQRQVVKEALAAAAGGGGGSDAAVVAGVHKRIQARKVLSSAVALQRSLVRGSRDGVQGGDGAMRGRAEEGQVVGGDFVNNGAIGGAIVGSSHHQVHSGNVSRSDASEELPFFVSDAFDAAARTDADIAGVGDAYETRMARYNALDFGDLLTLAVALLAGCGPLRRRWRRRFGHILVDEWQDVSAANVHLLKLLAGHDPACGEDAIDRSTGGGVTDGDAGPPLSPTGVTVVGCDDQAIYGFRGASPAAFSHFNDHFAGLPHRPVRTLVLGENHRSSGAIVRACASLIGAAGPGRLAKRLSTRNAVGADVAIARCRIAAVEVGWIHSQVLAAANDVDDPVPLGDMAVLLRTRALVAEFAGALRERGLEVVAFSPAGGTGDVGGGAAKTSGSDGAGRGQATGRGGAPRGGGGSRTVASAPPGSAMHSIVALLRLAANAADDGAFEVVARAFAPTLTPATGALLADAAAAAATTAAGRSAPSHPIPLLTAARRVHAAGAADAHPPAPPTPLPPDQRGALRRLLLAVDAIHGAAKRDGGGVRLGPLVDAALAAASAAAAACPELPSQSQSEGAVAGALRTDWTVRLLTGLARAVDGAAVATAAAAMASGGRPGRGPPSPADDIIGGLLAAAAPAAAVAAPRQPARSGRRPLSSSGGGGTKRRRRPRSAGTSPAGSAGSSNEDDGGSVDFIAALTADAVAKMRAPAKRRPGSGGGWGGGGGGGRGGGRGGAGGWNGGGSSGAAISGGSRPDTSLSRSFEVDVARRLAASQGGAGLEAGLRRLRGLLDELAAREWEATEGLPPPPSDEADGGGGGAAAAPPLALTVTTIHAAKGREWAIVFVPRLNMDVLPLPPPGAGDAAAAEQQLDEERRLAYVACSRARRRLCVSWAEATPSGGAGAPSPFLDELTAAAKGKDGGGGVTWEEINEVWAPPPPAGDAHRGASPAVRGKGTATATVAAAGGGGGMAARTVTIVRGRAGARSGVGGRQGRLAFAPAGGGARGRPASGVGGAASSPAPQARKRGGRGDVGGARGGDASSDEYT